MLSTSDAASAIWLFLLWVSAGWLFARKWMEFSTISALCFSVTACSTGGLVPPKTDDVSLIFTGCFVLTGVPIFALALSSVSTCMIRPWMEHRLHAKIKQNLDPAELFAADQSNPSSHGKDGMLDWGEFFEVSF